LHFKTNKNKFLKNLIFSIISIISIQMPKNQGGRMRPTKSRVLTDPQLAFATSQLMAGAGPKSVHALLASQFGVDINDKRVYTAINNLKHRMGPLPRKASNTSIQIRKNATKPGSAAAQFGSNRKFV
jgi:hypothetical protein